MLAGLVILALGLAFLTASALAWTGAWRRWSRQFLLGGPASPLSLFPAAGLIFAGAGLDRLGLVSVAGPAGALVALAVVAGVVLFFWSPRWLGPRWYREEQEELRAGRIAPDLQDGLTAATWLAATHTPGERASGARAAERFSGRAPVESWRVTWIVGDEDGERPHALGRAGAVSARLSLYDDGFTLAAEETEDRLRGEAHHASVTAGELRGARPLPPGAGPDGRRRPARGLTFALARRIVPRLAIETTSGPLLIETHGAAEKASRIAALGSDSAPGPAPPRAGTPSPARGLRPL